MGVVAINASPRKNWNTARLVRVAAEGAGTQVIDLYGLGTYSGCNPASAAKHRRITENVSVVMP